MAQVALLGAFVALAIWQLDMGAIAEAFAEVRVLYLPLALSIYLASRLVNAWEWQLLLTKVGEAPLFGLFGVLLIGTLVNAVLPANLGDVAKVQIAANRYSLPRAGVVAGRGAEAVVNGIVFIGFVVLSLVLLPGVAAKGLLWTVAGISALFCIATVAGSHRLPELAPGWLLRRIPERLRQTVESQWPRFHDGLETIRRPKLLGSLLLLNLFGWGVDIFINWSYGSAFNLDVPFSAYISVTVMLALITTVPLTFGNIGAWEFGVLGVLALYDVPADQAVAFAVGSHVFISALNVVFGLVAMALLRIKPGELLRLRSIAADASRVEEAGPGARGGVPTAAE